MSESKLRRSVIAGLAATLSLPLQARVLRPLAPMTDGPFYPPKSWRDSHGTWDADLTQVKHGGTIQKALGEYLLLELHTVDLEGHPLAGVEVDIWQCDVMKMYRHNVELEKGKYDEGFAGFGTAVSDAQGHVRFRTIKPVPYGGNGPHIHTKFRHQGYGTLTSRLWVDGDPDNTWDFNWRQTELADRPGLAFKILPSPAGTGVRWVASHEVVLPV